MVPVRLACFTLGTASRTVLYMIYHYKNEEKARFTILEKVS